MIQNPIHFYFCSGELAEWSNAVVLKTIDLHGSGGSNPSLSAKRNEFPARSAGIFCLQPSQTCLSERWNKKYPVSEANEGFNKVWDLPLSRDQELIPPSLNKRLNRIQCERAASMLEQKNSSRAKLV
jgi:hypothetical protein